MREPMPWISPATLERKAGDAGADRLCEDQVRVRDFLAGVLEQRRGH